MRQKNSQLCGKVRCEGDSLLMVKLEGKPEDM